MVPLQYSAMEDEVDEVYDAEEQAEYALYDLRDAVLEAFSG